MIIPCLINITSVLLHCGEIQFFKLKVNILLNIYDNELRTCISA